MTPDATWKRKPCHRLHRQGAAGSHLPGGRRVYDSPITEMRAYCAGQIDLLWDEVKRFENPHNYTWTCPRSSGTSSSPFWAEGADRSAHCQNNMEYRARRAPGVNPCSHSAKIRLGHFQKHLPLSSVHLIHQLCQLSPQVAPWAPTPRFTSSGKFTG